jgi:hypothetical protein
MKEQKTPEGTCWYNRAINANKALSSFKPLSSSYEDLLKIDTEKNDVEIFILAERCKRN